MAERLQQEIDRLKRTYQCSLQELIDAYVGEPSIPATAYDSPRTPYETTVLYLVEVEGLDRKAIAKLLHKHAASVRKALESARKKDPAVAARPEEPSRVPASAFAGKLSPAEAVVDSLARSGLINAEIADAIGRDPRNTWALLARARKKHGGVPQ